MRQFEIDATNPAQPRVLVDGEEQAGLTRASVDLQLDRPPVLFLQYVAGGRFQGAGDVVVQSDGPEAIRAWLTTVSPAALEDAALAVEAESMGSMSPGAKFKAGALRLLDGQHG